MPCVFGIAEDAQADVHEAGPERRLPVRGVVLAVVKEFVGARGHPHPERLGEALKRILRNAQRHQPGVALGARAFQEPAAPTIS